MFKYFTTIAGAAVLASSAMAHDLIIYPHTHTVNKAETFVAVEATSTNGLFRPDRGVSADGIRVYGADGDEIENLGTIITGNTRTSFELPINGEGTYKLEYVRDPIFFSQYFIGENNERKRLRYTTKSQAMALMPEGGKDLSTTKYITSSFAYVTARVPSDAVLAPTGKGLEIIAVTHPGDYVTGEDIVMAVSFNGEPLTNAEVIFKDEQAVYRGEHEKRVTYETDDLGELTFNFDTGGRYVIGVRHTVDSADPEADKEAYRLYYPFEVTFE